MKTLSVIRSFLLLSMFSVAAVLLSAAPGLSHTYEIIDLGFYDNNAALNNSGQVAATVDRQAVRWQNGSTTQLGYLDGGYRSYAYGINNSGVVTGYSRWASSSSVYPRERHAFAWNGGTMTDLGTLGNERSYGYDINDNGAVTGEAWAADSTRYHAFIWTESGGMQDIGTLGGDRSEAHAINNNNALVGNSRNGDNFGRAFIWTETGGMQELNTFINSSSANDINDSNQVVGYSNYSDGSGATPKQAVLWQDGTITTLGVLGDATSSEAFGINEQGQVVGTSEGLAFLWEDGVMADLNDLIDSALGWTLEEAYDINDNGQVLAHAVINGDNTLVLLNPVPVPGAVWLMASGLIGLIGFRRKRVA